MRLTSVAQMALPRGSLRSYEIGVGPVCGASLPVSFDQGRHVGRGSRPGSWMAVAVRLRAPLPDQRLEAAWLAVIARHATLRTVFSPAQGGGDGVGVRLHEVGIGPGRWVEHEVPGGRSTREVLRDVLDAGCSPYQAPSYRLVVVTPDASTETIDATRDASPDASPDASADASPDASPDAASYAVPDHRPAVVIASDHAHVDMWSLLVLVRDLVTCLEDLAAGRDPGDDLPPAPAFAEHTALLEAMPPTPALVRRRWTEILRDSGDIMPTFPLPLGDLSAPHPEVVVVRDVLDTEQVARLEIWGREHRVRLLAMAAAVMTRVTMAQAGEPLRIVFPVHSRFDPQWHGAVGWFITNSVLECTDDDPIACATSVAEAIELGSHPLAPVMAPYGGMPERPGMFALSWLDKRRMPVSVAADLELHYVSAVIRTDGVMVWFVVNETGLHLRCRYPDTPQAHASVGSWLEAVVDGLRVTAG